MAKYIGAAKYKGVARKIRPVNQPMPQDLNPPLERPPLSRDPYKTPLTPFPPTFQETSRVTEKRLKARKIDCVLGRRAGNIKSLLRPALQDPVVWPSRHLPHYPSRKLHLDNSAPIRLLMVHTRRSTKDTLFGPLPPPTRRRRPISILDRRRKIEYRQLSKLPPLPPLPPLTPPEIDNAHSPQTEQLTTLIDNLNNFTISAVATTGSELPNRTSPIVPDIDNRPPSPFLSPISHIYSQFLTRQPSPTVQPIPMSTPTTSDITPRAKFLQQPSIYKSDVEQLAADGSNFDKWKRGLTRIILLTLGHANFFDKSENYSKLSTQENTCLLFLIQITINDELSSLVDQYTKGTEAYDAVQTNFQGTVRFRQMELIDKLLEFRVTGPSTEPSQIPGLFNKLFETFSGLTKVGAGLSPLVESLILQAVVPSPASMSRSQLFQNISLQLGKKPDVTARDIQTIITSAYGESLRFDSSPSTNVSV
ncbi:uncharacterized protein PGTG_21298 [Puccinia graminis f. sp. tritici CRL 75-36-700-3]|uniref:Dcp1p-Dcp2p decapping enzyme complex alpha subunit n=1 Tax=Puccinia graminis f. sp. tritici (strain CRL 75-36-700-3 / race SCCL) TaxID=418459 RepID=H6QR31_PUCGT|nr:uncharacterized protein PGTG_21298 [Puccinia graminis f. sp. tritici CRL 75-36-700-3]EHS63006.1 hypothetical protein PGTG_21298 [Puccinia graminis f. sp. tritici CRL 75-36-700-3]